MGEAVILSFLPVGTGFWEKQSLPFPDLPLSSRWRASCYCGPAPGAVGENLWCQGTRGKIYASSITINGKQLSTILRYKGISECYSALLILSSSIYWLCLTYHRVTPQTHTRAHTHVFTYTHRYVNNSVYLKLPLFRIHLPFCCLHHGCQMLISFSGVFQSAVKTAESVSAFKNWTPFWGAGRVGLHPDCPPVSEYKIWCKNWMQNVLLNIADRLVNCCLIILAGEMNLGLFSTHSVIIYNTPAFFQSFLLL